MERNILERYSGYSAMRTIRKQDGIAKLLCRPVRVYDYMIFLESGWINRIGLSRDMLECYEVAWNQDQICAKPCQNFCNEDPVFTHKRRQKQYAAGAHDEF